MVSIPLKYALRAKLFKIIDTGFKLAVFGASAWYVYSRLEGQTIALPRNFSLHTLVYILPVLLLLPMNWILEAKKWKLLINTFHPLGLSGAVKSVLAGIPFGLITPNRIGEMAGRVIYSKVDVKKGLVQTALGSLSQSLLTLMGGIAGLAFLFPGYFPGWDQYYRTGLILSLIIIVLITAGFLKMPSLIRFIHTVSASDKVKKYLSAAESMNTKQLLSLLHFSFARYIVFCLQFYFLLLCFNPDLPFLETLAAVSVTFLLNSIVPSTALTEIGVRTSAAIFCLSFLSLAPTQILSASLVLWCLNILIPSVAGMFFLGHIRLFNAKGLYR